MLASIITPDANLLSLLICTSSYIKDLVVRPIEELILFILEDLEPSRVSAPDLHVVGST
jgi:hypothetical protein